MATNEGAGAMRPGTTSSASIWQDMLFLDELRREMGAPSGGDGSEEIEQGYKPYPRDPRWLVWLTWLLLFITVAVVVMILAPHMGF